MAARSAVAAALALAALAPLASAPATQSAAGPKVQKCGAFK